MSGIRQLVAAVGADLTVNGETLPEPWAAGSPGHDIHTAS